MKCRCGKEFEKTNGNQKFCSKECRKIKSICELCGKEFTEYKEHKKYCSRKCYHKSQIKKKLKKTCEFCGEIYEIGGSRFCSSTCMYEWRKSENWTETICLHCGKKFKHRKKEKRLFCSENCQRRSDYKKRKLSIWMKKNNPMNDPEKIKKIASTKLERYGDSNYKNVEKYKETMLARYGVEHGVQLANATSNGITISKPQQQYFNKIKKQFPDAILEHYLTDANHSVDIFIPSLNKVIEIYGDYWHCNPELFNSDFYHPQLHMKAKDKWEFDKLREEKIKECGYEFEVIWEKNLN